MIRNLQMEQFSLAYIRAVAAQSGYQVTRPEPDLDSVDGVLMASFGRRPRIEFQAKSTSRDVLRTDGIRFPIPVKNYNELRADTRIPRILIVVLMPQEIHQWIHQTTDELCLRHCAYWLSLEGQPSVSSTSSVSVTIPTTNIFDRAQLGDLMTRVDAGEALC